MLKTLHDYFLIEKQNVETTTSSGIILTSGKEKSKLATVKAIGSGVEKPEYKVGDRVLYREYAGTNMKVDDEEFIVIKDEDIIASEE